MSRRQAVSKRVRFEVFKRDGFECQYCGATPPGSVLHIDHIKPVAEGGQNDSDNLVTACETCNQGKGARLLSSVPASLAQKSSEIAEREAQLRGYREIMDQKAERIENETWEVAEVLEPGSSEKGFNRRNLFSIGKFIEKLGIHEVKDAAGYAYHRKPWSENQRFKYFCGICWKKIREAGDALAEY